MARDDEPEPADLAREREREWQEIIENFGDRAVLEPGDEPVVDAPRRAAPDDLDQDDPGATAAARDQVPPDEEFVPPTPPPVPRPPFDRLLAWTGVFGVPALVLFFIVVGVTLPAWTGLLFAAAFIGGFGYLVIQMPDEPRDPWDDGAVL
ncbi:hypothetical protein SFC88_07635 [Nocardioides sp. HM23]|uniref:hypothetical protein n=1 Tax=Nocardioides bizhenqiangii TaxID=3095076 RepID=UPI002ACA01FB|nr:hypothetical protein [Nocardioides sp. HM23]MDZ5620690.1 hypothetical protein [Nocardioides sp. HM23]